MPTTLRKSTSLNNLGCYKEEESEKKLSEQLYEENLQLRFSIERLEEKNRQLRNGAENSFLSPRLGKSDFFEKPSSDDDYDGIIIFGTPAKESESLREENSRLREEIEKLKTPLTTEEINALNLGISFDFYDEHSSEEERVVEEEGEISSSDADSDVNISKVLSLDATSTHDFESYINEIVKLKKVNQCLQQEIESTRKSAEADLDPSEAESVSLPRNRRRSISDVFSTENQELRESLSKLQAELAEKVRITELLEQKLSPETGATAISELRDELALLKEALAKKDSENQILTATQGSAASDARVFALKKENEAQKSQIERFEKEKKHSETTSQSNLSTIRALEAQIADGPRKLADLRNQLESVNAETSSLRQEVEDKVRALEEVKEINTDLQTKLKEESEAKKNAEKRLLELQTENAALIKQLHDQKQVSDAEEDTTHAVGRINIINTRATDAENLSRELALERDAARAEIIRIEGLRANEEAAKILAENSRANEERLRLAAEASEAAKEVERATVVKERLAITIERNAIRNNLVNMTAAKAAEEAARLAAEAREAAALIDAANKERLRLDAERLKTAEETAKTNALARLTASEKSLLDLQKSSSYETSVARSQRDKALEDIERLQRRLEKQSSAPEHKIIREFEKTFQPNYNKASDLLFGDKTEKERKIEIDYYRNHRHKIYQDNNTKLAHTKIDLSEASDEEIIREITKDKERAVKNSLPKLVAKLIGQKNQESVIEKLSRADIVIALSVGNSEEFNQWKKDNPNSNIGDTFFGKLEKGSKEQEIRSKAIENLLEGIKNYAAFFGVDDSKEELRPNKSPKPFYLSQLGYEPLENKIESRNQSIANRQRNFNVSSTRSSLPRRG